MKIDTLVMRKLKKAKQNQYFLFFVLIRVVLNSNKNLNNGAMDAIKMSLWYHKSG